MTLFDLTGKTALLTGATQGLGLAIAQGLGQAGATLIINGRNPAKLAATVERLQQQGFNAQSSLFDVNNSDAVVAAITAIEQQHNIDILVNNAGIIIRQPLAQMSDADFLAVVETDLVAPFKVAKAAVKGMLERGQGKIINLCSMMSELGRDGVGAYAAAKGGLKMLTRNMATEWARHGIQVNGIGPGYFATDITAPLREADHPFDHFIKQRTPAGRWGQPEELQGTAVFLASSASDFVNGQIIYVDGGILATLGRPAHEH